MNRTLYDVYKKPSNAKRRAWEYCRRLCDEYKGHDLHVVSYNVYMFTASFDCIVDGKSHYMYITKSKDVLKAY